MTSGPSVPFSTGKSRRNAVDADRGVNGLWLGGEAFWNAIGRLLMTIRSVLRCTSWPRPCSRELIFAVPHNRAESTAAQHRCMPHLSRSASSTDRGFAQSIDPNWRIPRSTSKNPGEAVLPARVLEAGERLAQLLPCIVCEDPHAALNPLSHPGSTAFQRRQQIGECGTPGRVE